MNLVCLSVCVFVHVFRSNQNPRIMKFCSMCHLGHLTTWRSPIFDIFIFSDSRSSFFFVFSPRKYQQFQLWHFDNVNIFIPRIWQQIWTENPRGAPASYKIDIYSGYFFYCADVYMWILMVICCVITTKDLAPNEYTPLSSSNHLAAFLKVLSKLMKYI